MAKPREVRGWTVYAAAVAVSFLVLAFRLQYEGRPSPYLLVPFADASFLVAALTVALAAIGLHQALWYLLVKPGGVPLYAASLAMFLVGLLLFYALPGHLDRRDLFLMQFSAALVLFLYVPALSYRSPVFLGIGVAGSAVVFGSSLYGPLEGSAPLMHPLVVGTIAAEGILLVLLLRLLQLSLSRPRGSPA